MITNAIWMALHGFAGDSACGVWIFSVLRRVECSPKRVTSTLSLTLRIDPLGMRCGTRIWPRNSKHSSADRSISSRSGLFVAPGSGNLWTNIGSICMKQETVRRLQLHGPRDSWNPLPTVSLSNLPDADCHFDLNVLNLSFRTRPKVLRRKLFTCDNDVIVGGTPVFPCADLCHPRFSSVRPSQ